MDFRSFLTLADDLLALSTEAAWRSAVSRSYYAAFHIARKLFRDLGFVVPHADRAHGYLWLRLANSGHPDVVNAGRSLSELRKERNRADYDDRYSLRQLAAGMSRWPRGSVASWMPHGRSRHARASPIQ